MTWKKQANLLDELNAGSQVHPEVDELPLNALLLVLLLLQHEHVVVEELLQFLIGEVDAQLLQAVELHKMKSSTLNGFFSSKIDYWKILLLKKMEYSNEIKFKLIIVLLEVPREKNDHFWQQRLSWILGII